MRLPKVINLRKAIKLEMRQGEREESHHRVASVQERGANETNYRRSSRQNEKRYFHPHLKRLHFFPSNFVVAQIFEFHLSLFSVGRSFRWALTTLCKNIYNYWHARPSFTFNHIINYIIWRWTFHNGVIKWHIPSIDLQTPFRLITASIFLQKTKMNF